MAVTRDRAGGHDVSRFEIGHDREQSYVLVHGIGASVRTFGPLARRLVGSGHVLALDLPGFGRSPGRRGPCRYLSSLASWPTPSRPAG